MAASENACIIGRGLLIKGSLSGAEEVIVEGRVQGSVELQGHLIIEPAGEVQADVVAQSVSVFGELEGAIEASQVIHVGDGGRVAAELRAPRVVIDDGAFFTGRIEMDVPLPEDV